VEGGKVMNKLTPEDLGYVIAAMAAVYTDVARNIADASKSVGAPEGKCSFPDYILMNSAAGAFADLAFQLGGNEGFGLAKKAILSAHDTVFGPDPADPGSVGSLPSSPRDRSKEN